MLNNTAAFVAIIGSCDVTCGWATVTKLEAVQEVTTQLEWINNKHLYNTMSIFYFTSEKQAFNKWTNRPKVVLLFWIILLQTGPSDRALMTAKEYLINANIFFNWNLKQISCKKKKKNRHRLFKMNLHIKKKTTFISHYFFKLNCHRIKHTWCKGNNVLQ